MIGLAVAGAGWLGEALIRDLHQFPVLELRAVQDARPDVAARAAELCGAAWHGAAFDAMLARPDVDAVAICTPNALHGPQAQAALRAGKHVLVQKPLAVSYADAVATIEMARHVGRLLFVDYTYRFLETMRSLRAVLDQPLSIRAAFHNIYGPGSEKAWFFDPKLSGGGALMDLGVHLIDLALWLLSPRIVQLERAELVGEPVEHSATLRLRLDGVPFEVSVSWNAPLSESIIELDVAGAGVRARWENVGGSFFRFRTLRDDEVVLERETTLREDTLRAFCEALESGVAPPIDARVYALLDQAYGRLRMTA
jgi:predicted dehydrogenase